MPIIGRNLKNRRKTVNFHPLHVQISTKTLFTTSKILIPVYYYEAQVLEKLFLSINKRKLGKNNLENTTK
jgi:hypothetical protein